MNRGIKEFGAVGAEAVHKEMKQLHDRKVPIPVDPSKLSRGERRSALQYLMFLKRKRDGTIKGRGCADGRVQRTYTSKEESSSPTVSIEATTITCAIAAAENRCVATVDIPGAFMQADMDEKGSQQGGIDILLSHRRHGSRFLYQAPPGLQVSTFPRHDSQSSSFPIQNDLIPHRSLN